MEFYTYDHSPFDDEPISIEEHVEAAVMFMQARDPDFDADAFRKLVASQDQEELKNLIQQYTTGSSLRYNNKEWLEDTISGNMAIIMHQKEAC
ncbi:MAG: hypothetical protein H6908_01080 [Hyphomicrobiales bacterium]|nr:hypothetical protein [Rickettsiales bacterium]MCP5361225.1 hypothetical protein [Hyphomicrobiales bacterium]